MGGERLRETAPRRFRQVVRDDLGEAAEPEVRELREDLPLVRDAGRRARSRRRRSGRSRRGGGGRRGRRRRAPFRGAAAGDHRQGSFEHGFGHARDSRAADDGRRARLCRRRKRGGHFAEDLDSKPEGRRARGRLGGVRRRREPEGGARHAPRRGARPRGGGRAGTAGGRGRRVHGAARRSARRPPLRVRRRQDRRDQRRARRGRSCAPSRRP